MIETFLDRKVILGVVVGIVAAEGISTVNAQWTQWGGPKCDFSVETSGLAKEWSSEGPKKLWSRSLGDGYSAVLVDDGKLYTMYRADKKERFICLDAKTGETKWEYAYDSDARPNHAMEFGDGPRATPLIIGDKLFGIGVSGVMHCVDKNTGKVNWKHDLWTEYEGNVLPHGYSSSPLAYKDMVIALVGGKDAAIVALKQSDGALAWKGMSFENSYSTPQILKINGEDQLVTFMATEVVGVNPNDGKLLWSHPHENQWKQNVSLPVMIGELLFVSSNDAGAKGLKITKKGDKYEVEEAWTLRKAQFYHVNTVHQGEMVYGSINSTATGFMAGVNAKTGDLLWRERGFAKANCLLADGKLIILDEDGQLALATANPKGLTIHSKVDISESVCWTVPTLVGKTLYFRDKKDIAAFDLG